MKKLKIRFLSLVLVACAFTFAACSGGSIKDGIYEFETLTVNGTIVTSGDEYEYYRYMEIEIEGKIVSLDGEDYYYRLKGKDVSICIDGKWTGTYFTYKKDKLVFKESNTTVTYKWARGLE